MDIEEKPKDKTKLIEYMNNLHKPSKGIEMYLDQIYSFLKVHEMKFIPDENYME